MTFKVGDKVEFHKGKIGTIVAIVSAFCDPYRYVPPGFRCRAAEYGRQREHASYLVRIDDNLCLCWPKVVSLKLVQERIE